MVTSSPSSSCAPPSLLQRRDMITKHQVPLHLIRGSTVIPNCLSLNPSTHKKQQHPGTTLSAAHHPLSVRTTLSAVSALDVCYTDAACRPAGQLGEFEQSRSRKATQACTVWEALDVCW